MNEMNHAKITRCPWPNDDPLMLRYHDEEWGEPVHDDGTLFEFLILEGFQAGLSWHIILKKRENFRTAFDSFDYNEIALYGKRKINSLLKNQGIVRNKLKIEGAVANARAFLKVREESGTFDAYIWGFVDGRPIQNKFKSLSKIPATTELSDIISRDLKKRGFKFVGPTVIYAHMQATGMVNDHLVSCFRHAELCNRKGL